MTKNKKTFKKKFLLGLIIFQIFFLAGGQAFIVNGANLLQPGDVIEPTPNLTDSVLKGPTLNILFDESSLISGKMKASANTMGFNDSDEKLYFTWYLKKANGKDLDGDGDYDENDWKIEAARIIATNGYSGENSGSSTNDGNDDGYKALPDWNGSNDNANCYVQDFEDGRTYELKETTEVFSCANPVCVSTKNLTCQEEDLPDYPGTYISVPGKKACQSELSTPQCNIINAENFTAGVSCNIGTPQCLSSFFSNILTDDQICSGIGSGEMGSGCPVAPIAITPTCKFEEKKDGNICKHLFAKPKGTGEVSGDGKFGNEEESFWGTDTRNISTAGNGNLDEANVIGLGINKFEWTYEKGDKIGLVVEGNSIMDTKLNDGRKMIMWAFSKNTCSAISDAAKKRSFYVKDSYDLKTGILSVGNLDLDDCLKENLIDPFSATENGYFDVSLSASPTEPMNDPLGIGALNRGNVITISSSVSNATNQANLKYNWDVEVSSDGTANPPLWKNINDEINEHSYFSGLGVSEFNFKLNLLYTANIFPNKNNEQFLRVKAVVSEANSIGKTGKGLIVIKIKQLGPEIRPFKATYSDLNGTLSQGGEICESEESGNIGKICFVSKNEIIGVSIPNEKGNLSGFVWKMNGAPLSCDASISSACQSGSAVNLAFFPILGMEGEIIEITAEAIDSKTGTASLFSKKFQIITPYVKIVSSDRNLVWPKQLGYFKNLDGTFLLDESDTLFQTIENSQVKLSAAFFPSYIASSDTTEINWEMNGNNFQGNDKASFVAAEQPGSSYNISVNATYIQPVATRMALEKIWGIKAAQTAEQKMEHSIQVEVIQSEYDEVVLKNTKKFLASIVSNIPSQVVFMLRLILTAALLVGISGLAFSFNVNSKK